MAALPKLSINDDSVYGEAEFSRGIVRDMPRSSIPVGGCYDLVDFMIDRPGVAYKRGGTAYQGGNVSVMTAGVPFVVAPEFPNGPKVIALGSDMNVYDVTTGSTLAGSLGMTSVDNPHLYVDKVIVAGASGLSPPKKITAPGTLGAGVVTVGDWGGSPPTGRLATVHLSRVILANSDARPNRIWFSPVPNPEATWDTATAYIDTNHFLSGICPCQGVLLAFSNGHTERIVGDIPPGSVDANMSVQPVGEVGCVDARSIAAWRGNAIFAGQGGIWVTNGVGFDSLIEKDDGSGLASYWREIYDTTAGMFGIFAGGVYGRDYYIICLSAAGTIVDTLMCYLPRKAWVRLTNVGVQSFATAFTGINELYGATIANYPGNRVIKFSSVFKPGSGNKLDADGTPVQPSLQLRMIGEGIGEKAYGHGHITYDLRDAASDNPVLELSAGFGIENSAGFGEVPEGSPLPETSLPTRRRYMVNHDAQTLNLSLVQQGPSRQTELYAIEQEVRPYNVTADSP